MHEQDVTEAIRVSAERLYDWLRDLMDLYQTDTGDPDPLVMPPWVELSEQSQGVFVMASGAAGDPPHAGAHRDARGGVT